MTRAGDAPELLRFSTDALPERDRLAIWSDVFGRHVVKAQFEPIGGHRYSQTATVRSLPGLSLVTATCSGFRATRTRQLIGDGNDDLILVINTTGISQYRQLGHETTAAPYEGILLSSADEGFGFYPRTTRHIVAGVPRQAIAAMVRDPESVVARPLPKTEPLRLLTSYVLSADDLTLATSELRHAFATHIQDLMALAIGTTRDGEAIALGRGMRAARQRAIKADIIGNLGRSELSITAVAARHRISPRYIQKLFESEGTTFTEYVLERRLAEANRMLRDPNFAGRNISEVAFKVGFGDLSYFTRSFRRRFGMTPSDARERIRRETDA
jgi:AraC-like DNA-binding protein